MEARNYLIEAVHAWKNDCSDENWQRCIKGMDLIMAEILDLEQCEWTYDQKSEMTIQLEVLINAVRQSDQIDNPGYRQGAFYGILEVGIRAIQDMMRRWHEETNDETN